MMSMAVTLAHEGPQTRQFRPSDFQMVLTRKANRFEHISFRHRLNDRCRKTIRLDRVPDHRTTPRFVLLIYRARLRLQKHFVAAQYG